MGLPYDSRKVANRLIAIARQSDESMSITRLLKFAYLAHGWTLAIIENPLVNDYVQAWRYGPVIPSIYYAFRPYGAYNLNPIPLVKEVEQIEFDGVTDDLLVSVYDLYKHLADSQLSGLTHIKGGPWHKKHRSNERNIIIPNDMIAQHFKDKQERANHSQSVS